MAHLLNAEQAGEFLGLHKDTVKRKAREGEIPAAKVGRGWRFDPDVLREWVRAGGTAYERQVDEGLALEVAESRKAVAEGRERVMALDDAIAEFEL